MLDDDRIASNVLRGVTHMELTSRLCMSFTYAVVVVSVSSVASAESPEVKAIAARVMLLEKIVTAQQQQIVSLTERLNALSKNSVLALDGKVQLVDMTLVRFNGVNVQ